MPNIIHCFLHMDHYHTASEVNTVSFLELNHTVNELINFKSVGIRNIHFFGDILGCINYYCRIFFFFSTLPFRSLGLVVSKEIKTLRHIILTKYDCTNNVTKNPEKNGSHFPHKY